MSPPVFRLVKTVDVSDTARCVAELAEGVARNEVIGLAYVVIYARRNYEVRLCGEADRNPTFARGAVGALDDKLSRRIHGEQ